jgi:hypothetical protein
MDSATSRCYAQNDSPIFFGEAPKQNLMYLGGMNEGWCGNIPRCHSARSEAQSPNPFSFKKIQ